MKLASLKSARDGALIVVSCDLSRAVPCPGWPTLQSALDHEGRLVVDLLQVVVVQRVEQLGHGSLRSRADGAKRGQDFQAKGAK